MPESGRASVLFIAAAVTSKAEPEMMAMAAIRTMRRGLADMAGKLNKATLLKCFPEAQLGFADRAGEIGQIGCAVGRYG